MRRGGTEICPRNPFYKICVILHKKREGKEMKRFKIAIVGLERGKFVLSMEKAFKEELEIVAVCENRPSQVEKVRGMNLIREGIRVYEDYDELLAKEELDAVCLFNYFPEHAPLAIKAMEKGIAVMSDTTAAGSLGECVQLAEAYEKYNGRYMLGANSTYGRRAIYAMKKLLAEKKYGDISYADAEYIHPPMSWEPVPGTAALDKENLHWRQTLPKCYYNMHDLGPLMYATGAMPKRVTCKAVAAPERNNRIVNYDSFFVLTEMDNGATFHSGGCTSTGAMGKWYRIACTGGTIETVRYDKLAEQLLECSGHGDPVTTKLSWSECGVLTPEEEEKFFGGEQIDKVHGGLDVVLLVHFIRFLKGEEEPFFDIYSALALSATGILAWYSALSDSKTLDIPDFRNKEDRDRVRNDFRKPFARKYSDLSMPCRLGEPFEL